MLGDIRGTKAAALDAAGAGLGSAGLAAFGAAVWYFSPVWGNASLVFAAIAWLTLAVLYGGCGESCPRVGDFGYLDDAAPPGTLRNCSWLDDAGRWPAELGQSFRL